MVFRRRTRPHTTNFGRTFKALALAALLVGPIRCNNYPLHSLEDASGTDASRLESTLDVETRMPDGTCSSGPITNGFDVTLAIGDKLFLDKNKEFYIKITDITSYQVNGKWNHQIKYKVRKTKKDQLVKNDLTKIGSLFEVTVKLEDRKTETVAFFVCGLSPENPAQGSQQVTLRTDKDLGSY
ncbi:hypothetical protein HYT84_00505 [Candidatus Micrarchaeota archaeon]|nr:hypothetical protein [Candidatus Micrarchaeota archaeon]